MKPVVLAALCIASFLSPQAGAQGFIAMMQTEDIKNANRSKEKLIKYQETIRKDGFSKDQLKAYKILHLTDQQINIYKQEILQEDAQNYSGNIFANWRAAIGALREVDLCTRIFPLSKLHGKNDREFEDVLIKSPVFVFYSA